MGLGADYWTEARRRIIEMRRIDIGFELVFGSNSHQYKILDPVSEKRLSRFEAKNGVNLPSEYRSFLSVFGAGGVGPHYGIYDFATVESISVQERFYLTESCEWPDDDDDPMWDLPGLLPLSTSGCAVDWSIEINGPQPGTMWVDAGPGDQLMRCDSFGIWYGTWLDRVEAGLGKYKAITDLVASGTAVAEISAECGIEPSSFEWDGVAYVRFQGVPGCIRVDGDRAVSLDVGTCWIL